MIASRLAIHLPIRTAMQSIAAPWRACLHGKLLLFLICGFKPQLPGEWEGNPAVYVARAVPCWQRPDRSAKFIAHHPRGSVLECGCPQPLFGVGVRG